MRKLLFILIAGILIIEFAFATNEENLDITIQDTTYSLDQTNSLFDSANFYEQIDLKKSITFAKKALENAIEDKNDSLITKLKILLASQYTKVGLYSDALKLLLDAIEYYEKTNDNSGQVSILKKVGDLLWYTGKFKEALGYYEEFGRYSNENNDTINYIRSYISKGAVYGNTNRLDTAIVLFKKALKLSKSIHNEYLINLSKFNIGDALLFSEKPYQSIIIFNELLEVIKNDKQNFSNIAGLYSSLASAHLKIKDLKSAKIYNQKALEFAKQNNILTELNTYYEFEFKIDTSLKDYKKALFSHIAHKKLTDSINDQKNQKELANFQLIYDLRKRQMEIDKLTLKNKISQSQLKRNRYYFISGTILIILLLALIRNIFRSRKKLNIKNKKLDEQKEELETTLEQLKQTQAQLLQSEKMASLGVLTTGIAHEINNPLNYINGGIYILEDVRAHFDSKNNDEINEQFNLALKMVKDGFNKSHSIVQSLMSFATRENSMLEEHSIKTMLKNTLTFLKPQLENITVETNCTETDKLLVYPDKLHQVFLNILDNAIKALAKVDNKKITVTTQLNKQSFQVSIQNNGPQIAKKHLDRLFDPFFTTRQPGEGVGMGLTISYNLIKEHKGEIKARNLTEGVEFLIELPV